MPWFKVDDAFWGHPKRLRCTPTAIGIWCVAGAYSAQQLTDGLIEPEVLKLIGGRTKDAAELVKAGLWDVAPNGWQFHDWGHYQRTRAEVETDRESARVRMKRARNGRRIPPPPPAEQPPEVPDEFEGSSPEHDANTERSSPDVALTPSRIPYPVSRIPYPDQKKEPSLPPQNRGSRITEAWKPSTEDVAWQRGKSIPDSVAALETEKFINYWLAKTGKDATKLDWSRTWQNWMLNAKGAAAGTTPAVASNQTAAWMTA